MGEEAIITHPVAALEDVVRDVQGLVHVEHDHIVVGHRSGRHALLMLPLAGSTLVYNASAPGTRRSLAEWCA
eukprot:1603246-Rhodomonas_salina.1